VPFFLEFPILPQRSCTLYFGFQRFVLSLYDEDSNNHSSNKPSLTSSISYMIVTKDKSRTSAIISVVPQLASERRRNQTPPLPKVLIANKDSQLLDAVSDITRRLKSDETDIVHYQILYQIWKQKPGVAIERSLIVTPKVLLLCEESIDPSSLNVTVRAIDSVRLKDIYRVRAEDDPLKLTLIMKPEGKVSFVKRKWRLLGDAAMAISRAYEEIRKVNTEL
jgi:hypothetical protein